MQDNINKFLEGKKGLITGVANNMSIALAIATATKAHGAEIALTYPTSAFEKRVTPLAEELGADFVARCDVTDQESVNQLFSKVQQRWGKLDFLVHSIAFADKNELKGRYIETSLSNFQTAMQISCYSLTALAQAAEPLMTDGGSIITLTYYGAEKVMPHYNVMGVAKAALEASVRYLAADMGMNGIRVNAISAGPMKTLAASAIGDFRSILDVYARSAPLRRNVTQQDVANAAIYLLSEYAAGVTGEIHYVDCGYNIMGLSSSAS